MRFFDSAKDTSVGKWFAMAGLVLLTACNGSGGGSSGSVNTGQTGPQPASISILANSTQLNSDNKTAVEITAIVKDSGNAAMAGQTVKFSTTDGVVTAENPVTGSNGSVVAKLNTSGDPSNRNVTVTATSGKVSSSVTVTVSGTSIAVSGTSSIVLNSSTDLVVSVTDSSGIGISNKPVVITSALGNTLKVVQNGNTTEGVGKVSTTTDSQGKLTVTVKGDRAGSDILTFGAAGAAKQFNLNVSSSSFQFIGYNGQTDVVLRTPQLITVKWLEGGQPAVGRTVNFSTTRGTLYDASQSGLVPASSSTTNSQGEASIMVASDQAGSAIVLATSSGGTTSNTISMRFVAATASRVDLQADRTTLGVFKPNNAASQATLTAVVRDSANNLVKNARVEFSAISDITGGTLSSPSALTDESGIASVVYTSGTISSPKDGVVIRATVREVNNRVITNGVSSDIKLTVAAQSLFVRLGTDNLQGSDGQTNYQKTYSAIVTDAAGNPVANQPVQFTFVLDLYYKGYFSAGAEEWVPTYTTVCASEDVNYNGILDPGEDINGNGQLTPGAVANVTATANTNADGIATTKITFPKEYAYWVRGTLDATVKVAGTETRATVKNIILEGVKGDYAKDKRPPGRLIEGGYFQRNVTVRQLNRYFTVSNTTGNNGTLVETQKPDETITPASQRWVGPAVPGTQTVFKTRSPNLTDVQILTQPNGTAVNETTTTTFTEVVFLQSLSVISPYGQSGTCSDTN
ncbi:Ig-like domain-containing protein [Parachitinimonas caeni]|uniref:Ig-like domain-containing protein n=1 Tax=Parachitinimonas caeni TaxID=3031301 RepID=A0ABT7DVU3_9NEIS|nr:Ig-like domain-containing protein [Parachitinimonas caeni]MDK2123233.1 Ig-like domain-containing protein [Parachitinimonas caeni]